MTIAVGVNADGRREVLGMAVGSSEAEQWAEVANLVEAGPIPAVHGVLRWRLIDLAQWIHEAFGVSLSKQTMSAWLRAMA